MQTLYTIHGNGLTPEIFAGIRLPGLKIQHLTIPGHAGLRLSPSTYFAEMVLELRQKIDTSRPYSLIGFSLGGHLAHHLSESLRPEKIISLAAPPLSPATLGQVFVPSRALGHLFTRDLNLEHLHELAASFLCLKPELTSSVVELLQQCDPQVRQNLGEDVAAGRFYDELEIMRQHGQRAHYVFAQEDTLLSRDYILSLELPNLHWVEGGHLIPWENPDALGTILRNIFQS